MQIIIPMAGSGKRFIDAGYKELKPLIPVDGKSMIEHVVNLFPQEKIVTFICNKTHVQSTPLKKVLKKIKPTGKIASIEYHPLGPVESVLRAQDFINDNEPTIVNYCDFSMLWDYKKFNKKTFEKNVDGAIICYKGFHPHLLGKDLYAGVKTKYHIMLEIKEKFSYTKNKMRSWHSAGCYYFKSGKLIKKYFQELKEEKISVNGEYYVSSVYELMKRDNLHIKIYSVPYFCQWGTPKDLQEYQYWSHYFHKTYEG